VADLASPLKTNTKKPATVTLLGRPELQAEGKLRIAGIRDPVDGEWVINRVEHQLDSSGLQTRCDAEVRENACGGNFDNGLPCGASGITPSIQQVSKLSYIPSGMAVF
jgi:hypothetical protein